MKRMQIRIPAEVVVGKTDCPDFFERMDVVAFFNIGHDIHTKVCRFELRDGLTIDDINPGKIVKELIILQNEGREYTCVMKGELPDEITLFIREFDLKLEYPVTVEQGRCTVSIVGSPEELHTILDEARKKGWDTEILAVEEYNPHISGIFRVLTTKQRKVLTEAYQAGYFEQPRRIDAGMLAKKLGMHKTTVLDHIHKAEKRLIGHIIQQTM